MVSHQSQIEITQVNGSSATEECLSDMCPSQLMRAETAYSERQQPETMDVQTGSVVFIVTELQEQNPDQRACIKTSSSQSPDSITLPNLVVGSMYWQKVANNKVYPKWVSDFEKESVQSRLKQSYEEKGHELYDDDSEVMDNISLEYDSQSEWYDCDTTEHEKCLSA